MGVRKWQKSIVGVLGGAAAAVVIGMVLANGGGIARWVKEMIPRSPVPSGGGCYIGPPIDAFVDDLNVEDRIVILSVGEDQKVREGFEFTVYRVDRFVGKIRVTRVFRNSSRARILFTNEGETFQVGDKAATQI